MHRLFVAILPPAPVRMWLRDHMHGVEGARWQSDAQLHLTLRFIGEVDRHVANDIAAALSAVHFTPFDIAVDGVGMFDKRGRPDALWAGVRPHDELRRLQAKVDRACVSAGAAVEARAYLPHITMARLNRTAGPVDGFLAREAGLSCPPFRVEHFHLMESSLGREGSSYEAVERYALRG